MTRQSDAICERLAAVLDPELRRGRAMLFSDFLNLDADRHALGLVFRWDAAGRVHCYERWHFAFEYAARRKDSFVGRVADGLMRACGGPELPLLAEVEKRLAASQNSQIRADLRKLEECLSRRQRALLRASLARGREIQGMFRQFSGGRWPEIVEDEQPALSRVVR